MKKIINILLSFFMTVVISVTGCLATSSPFIKAVVSISDYKHNIEPEISDSLKSVAIPSGLPEDFFNDKIKSEYIDRIINESIEAAINKQDYTMPLDELEQLIYDDIVAYANEHQHKSMAPSLTKPQHKCLKTQPILRLPITKTIPTTFITVP